MRIVLHAGLHKSGTTSVQHMWRQAFARGGEGVWYPGQKGARHPGHHAFVWPLLVAFTERRANDLIWSATRSAHKGDLADVLKAAERRGVQTLLISTEELDRVEPEDVDRLGTLLSGHDVTAVFTATRPVHRWCSGWQELVKHGSSQYPRDAAEDIMAFASLAEGRLQQLTELIPAARHIIRVVRTNPPEDDLAQDLSELAGLTWPAGLRPARTHNVSMGVDVEVLRRINRLDLSLGTVDGGGRPLIAALKPAEPRYAERPELADAYELPPAFWAATKAESEFLADPGAGVDVVDPHGELEHWRSGEVPDWYAEVRTRELVVPQLDVPVDPDEMLWRVRQERSALRNLLDRAVLRMAELEAEVATAETSGSASTPAPPPRAGVVARVRRRIRRRVGGR
ncbi:MAG TPA: hypothetical protein VME70_14960 [Mycobacteriales bacterium]|nr:hypothetical protein [Mycobacteriales bacterium]